MVIYLKSTTISRLAILNISMMFLLTLLMIIFFGSILLVMMTIILSPALRIISFFSVNSYIF